MYFSEHNKKGWRLLGVPFIFAIFLLAVPIATMTTLSFWTQDYLTLIKTITLGFKINALASATLCL